MDVVSVDVFGYSISAQIVCPALLRSASGIRSDLRDEGTTTWSGWHEEACPSQDFQSGGKCRYAYLGNCESQYVACGVTVLRSIGRRKLVFIPHCIMTMTYNHFCAAIGRAQLLLPLLDSAEKKLQHRLSSEPHSSVNIEHVEEDETCVEMVRPLL